MNASEIRRQWMKGVLMQLDGVDFEPEEQTGAFMAGWFWCRKNIYDVVKLGLVGYVAKEANNGQQP